MGSAAGYTFPSASMLTQLLSSAQGLFGLHVRGWLGPQPDASATATAAAHRNRVGCLNRLISTTKKRGPRRGPFELSA